MRRRGSTFSLLLVGFLLMMWVGDRLPDPIGRVSSQMKQTVNGFIVGLFPSWDPDLNPHQRTESQLQQTEARP